MRKGSVVLLPPLLAAILVLAGMAGAARGSAPAPSGYLQPVLTLDGPGSLLLGGVAAYYANVSSGVPPFTFAWSLNGTGWSQNISSSNATSRLSLRPLGDSIYTIDVNVTDKVGNRTAQQISLFVSGPSPVQISLNASAGAAGSFSFRATATGGTPPYLYRWIAPGANTSWNSSGTLTLGFLPLGSSTIRVLARDAHGYVGTTWRVIDHSVQSGSNAPAVTLDVVVGIGAGLAAGLAGFAWVRTRRRTGRDR